MSGGPESASAPAAAPPSELEREVLPDSPEPSPQAEPPRAIVPRWVQLVLLPVALFALWALAKAAGKVLLIFVVAAVIALILNPAVAFVQRPRVPRGLAVLIVYLAFFLTLVGIGFLLANPISNQVRTFTDNLPHIAARSQQNDREPCSATSTSTASIWKSSNRARRRCRASRTKSPRAPANSCRSAAAC